MERSPDPRDVALGLAVGGARASLAAGRLALLPARVAVRAPVLGAPLRRAARDFAHEGSLTRARARAQLEAAAGELLAAPELERAADRLLAGALTDAVGRSLAAHRVIERLVIRVLESRLVDELTEQVLRSPEMERVVEHIATSPQVLDAVSQQTQTLAEEMLSDVRRRTHTVDELAERTVRGWLRRPRPSPS